MTNDIIKLVKAELNNATNMFGPFHSAHEGMAILREEFDELWEAVRMKQTDHRRIECMHEEAVQVAAMAIRFLIDCIPTEFHEEIITKKD